MPRRARIDAPGALHHIMVRGIERRRIFRDDEDRNGFVDRLGRVLEESSTACYAWVLMPNHVREMGATATSVARQLGISQPAVSMAEGAGNGLPGSEISR